MRNVPKRSFIDAILRYKDMKMLMSIPELKKDDENASLSLHIHPQFFNEMEILCCIAVVFERERKKVNREELFTLLASDRTGFSSHIRRLASTEWLRPPCPSLILPDSCDFRLQSLRAAATSGSMEHMKNAVEMKWL